MDARALLETLLDGRDDLAREGLAKTPERFARALTEMLGGYDVDLGSFAATSFDAEGYDQVVVVSGIPFASLCEHHVLPFTGIAHVGYLPGSRIIGLSKIPRLVRAVSRRLQVQERMTQQIADALAAAVTPKGVAVIVEGTHSCMLLRGAETPGRMVTSCMRGVFRDHAAARAEVLRLFGC